MAESDPFTAKIINPVVQVDPFILWCKFFYTCNQLPGKYFIRIQREDPVVFCETVSYIFCIAVTFPFLVIGKEALLAMMTTERSLFKLEILFDQIWIVKIIG